MSPTEVRARLAVNGFTPVPCNGKAPVLKEWQKRTETSADDIDIWAKIFPDAQNTGVVTTSVPALDLDILDETAVDAAVALVQECFGERGKVMLRYGRRPKVAIPFRTDAPFAKIQVLLTAPDGSTGEKVEFLGHGQQIVVDGFHPDTHALYEWRDGNPCSVKRDELPLIDEAAAQALVDDVVALVKEHGYQIANGKREGNGKDNGANGGTDWGHLYENIRVGRDYHESLLQISFKLICARTDDGKVVEMLQNLMQQSEAPHDARWQNRFNDIPRLVTGALELLRKPADRKPPPPPEPGPAPDGAAVLGRARDYLKKYVAYPSSHALVAHTLLCAHTHLLEAFDSTARVAFLSAFPESGKTRALEATEPLVCRPISTVNASANYLFRKAGDAAGPPTVLFDEIDTIFGKKAKEHEDIRGFINAGHRRGATFGHCRVVGNTVLTEESPCYAAVMMAGLGWLPDTLLSRSVVIRMHRRLKSEKVTPFRTRTSIPEGQKIGAQLAKWAMSVFEKAAAARPELPEGVEDRQADAWEPVLAVADLAGGEWPELAREAAVALVKVNRDTPLSLKLRLLRDSRLVFWQNLMTAVEARPMGLLTEVVLNGLYQLEEAPWGVINKGEQFTDAELSKHMEDYGVEPLQLRPCPGNRAQRRGYPLKALAMAWRRYLKPLSLPLEAVTSVTDVTRKVLDEYFDWVAVDDEGNLVTEVTAVTGSSRRERDQETETSPDVTSVTPSGEGEEVSDNPETKVPNFAHILTRQLKD
jgi:hypothetical protein